MTDDPRYLEVDLDESEFGRDSLARIPGHIDNSTTMGSTPGWMAQSYFHNSTPEERNGSGESRNAHFRSSFAKSIQGRADDKKNLTFPGDYGDD